MGPSAQADAGGERKKHVIELMYHTGFALMALAIGVGALLGAAIGVYAAWLSLRREFFNADGSLRSRDDR